MIPGYYIKNAKHCNYVNAQEIMEKVLSRELQASRFKQEGLSVAELRNLGSYGSTSDQINFVADMTYEISKLKYP